MKWTVDSSLSAMLTSMSYKGSPLPPCKWCARRSASLSHSPSWRSSRSHPSHVETPRHHSASRSRTHPSSQHSLRPLQGTAPRPRGPRCASRAAPASSTLPTTLSSCDGRPPAAQAGPRRPLRHYLRLCLPVTGAPRCASRAAPASSTLPTTLSSCDGRPMEQHMHMPAGARPSRALRPAAQDTVSEARHVTSSRTCGLGT